MRGPEGSILGLLKEEDGIIVESKLLMVIPGLADRWLTIGSGRKVVGA